MNSEIYQVFQRSSLPVSKYDTYFDAYEELFAKYKNKRITFVEIGILGGGSLEAWKKYFSPSSRIIGIDLNPALGEMLTKKGYEVHIGDQADPEFWRKFFEQVGKIDVLLDDGGHSNLQTWMTLKCAIGQINDGGTIVIEDTHASYMRAFGNPSKRSFVRRSKGLVDELNYRSYRIKDTEKRNRIDEFETGDFAKYIHSIKFYESIVAFSIDSRLARVPKMTNFGFAQDLPSHSLPDDFRHRGISDPDLQWGRLRELVRRIRAKIFHLIRGDRTI